MRRIIYGLLDPRSGQLRYIGKSTKGLVRARQHGLPAMLARDSTHKGNWIRSLQKAGVKYETAVLEEVPTEADINEAERFAISYFRFIGCNLTNLSAGGDGAPHRFTEEHRTRLAEAARSSAAAIKHREELANAQRGCARRPHTDAEKERLREANLGRRHTADALAKMSAASRRFWSVERFKRLGVPLSRETRLKISQAQGCARLRASDGRVFDSFADAARALGVHPVTVARAVRRNGRTRGLTLVPIAGCAP